MSLTLILMRHAKSSWADKTLDDFDRPLNGRGRRSAPAVGEWLAERGYLPGDVVVSGARRTVDTWAALAPKLQAAADMRSSPALYPGSAEAILAVLNGARADTVLLIGHNPSFAEFAEKIVEAPGEHPRFGDFPTAATAVITFEAKDWSSVTWGQGQLKDFVVPRELLE